MTLKKNTEYCMADFTLSPWYKILLAFPANWFPIVLQFSYPCTQYGHQFQVVKKCRIINNVVHCFQFPVVTKWNLFPTDIVNAPIPSLSKMCFKYLDLYTLALLRVQLWSSWRLFTLIIALLTSCFFPFLCFFFCCLFSYSSSSLFAVISSYTFFT